MMKKIILLFVVSCFLFGCNDLSLKEGTNKTSFLLHEDAKIDSFNLVMTDYRIVESIDQLEKPIHDQFLIVEFEIENTDKTSQIISADTSYQLLIDGKTYHNVSSSDAITIPSKQKTTYTIVYDVPKRDTYHILFYSGIVSNNIKFEIIL